MRAKNMVLVSIILGLCINLFADLVWHYLPDKEVHPNTYVVVTVTLVIMCLLLLIFGSEGSKKNLLAILWQKLVPRKTIEFIPYTDHGRFNNYWNNGEVNGKSAMQVQGEWYATNRTDESIRILRVYLVKPRTEGWADTENSYARSVRNEDTFGNYWISPGECDRVKVMLWIQPPICEEGEDLTGKIVFIDQLNRKYKVKTTFEYCGQEW